jgi:hypothetical protein
MNDFLRRLFRQIRTLGDETVLPDERRFRIGERTVIIRPLVLGQIKVVSADLGEILHRIITQCPEIDIDHFDQHLTTLLPALAGALEEFLGKLLDIEPEYLMQHLTPLLCLRIVRALLEVNQVPLLIAEMRAMAPLLEMAPVL